MEKELNQEQLSVADLTEDGNLIHENKTNTLRECQMIKNRRKETI